MRFNMPVEFEITDSDIRYAEGILLPDGKIFCNEAIDFIKNIDTVDLQAVPGSGKTTVLLAKLLIFERYLPFEDGSGILVISHTNTAVDEIKNKIGKYCPKLSSYPNFIGTIQSFVDKFLAIPYYAREYGKKPWKFEANLYSERAEGFSSTCIEGLSVQDQKNAKYYLRLKDIASKYRFDIDDGNLVVLDKLNGKILDFEKPVGRTKPENYTDFTAIEKDNIKKWLIEFKNRIMVNNGILHYDDAYFLAKSHLVKYPQINKILQKRFSYVFVDEMQDMDRHQYDLLEEIFYNNTKSQTAYQRIGDKNQAIFSGDIKLEDIWIDRDKVFPLTNSRRLPKAVAEVVKPFAIKEQSIEGCNNTNEDGTENNILPHVIVFDDSSVERVIPKFCELVKEFKDEGRIPANHKHSINAIAWIGKEGAKFGLRNYWAQYESSTDKKKSNNSLSEEELNSIYKDLIEVMLKVLRIEGIINPQTNRYFTANSLKKYLKETNEKYYDRFKLRFFEWSCDIYKGESVAVYQKIKQTIPRILKHCFNIELNKASIFINNELFSSKEVRNITSKKNIYKCEDTDVEVEVGTIHSIKGQTHTATLYMESYYDKDYESSRLKKCFNGEEHKFSDKPDKDVRKKESLKMVYVGFSRPTHLLCFAVHKKRYNADAFALWEPIFL